MRKITAPTDQSLRGVEPGPAPMLDWIAIERLVIDDDFQRPLSPHNWKAIRQIATTFRWSRFAPVLCAPIEGGRYSIIDGQHRVHAAAMCGVEAVPCQIVQIDKKEQAASFAAVNGNVTKITTVNLLKAALAAGEQWALECKSVADAAGCKLMLSNGSSLTKKPGEIYAIKVFKKMVDTIDRDSIIKSLQIILQTEGFRENADLWDISILGPVIIAMTDRSQYLDRADFVSFLDLYEIWDAIDGVEAENKRRIGNGLPRISKRESIRLNLLTAIDEAMADEDEELATSKGAN
ncbi:chromosome partitioning protein ParB [Brucella tritici]|uniref:Chromosome partitioning protein ParB n=1 Tax=Brucella tritici TaxID=94626 RepID=A0A833CM99_9HYPH|nr:ParB N-terminal domain-containing protein [Brucella tritici]KAB2665177.1 chromosome partitioning protein ParB [Brucella tritici]